MSVSEAEQSVSTSFEANSNPPDFEDSEFIINDSACGEPLVAHKVSLDFTPNDLDNEFVQRKCCAFWDYINSRPELKNINPVPDLDVNLKVSEPSVVQLHLPSQARIPSHTITKTAVNMLEFVEDKGLIDRAFEAKLPKSNCEINHMVSSNESMIGISKAHQLEDDKGLKNKKAKRKSDLNALPKLRIMCNKMHEWDINHPKSMNPPGPSPVLPEDIKLIKS